MRPGIVGIITTCALAVAGNVRGDERQAAGAPVQAAGRDTAASRADRPTIGLALGGGSARGIAHIGVLEWFEQHRIPIDYIAGTSMGGLIAGAYATGMSPAEIRTLIKEADWDLMFLADSPFEYKTFRRKQDRRAFPSQLEFGLKHGFTLPGALNPGQQVTLLLDRIALPYYALDNFDALPTPFRCVATDLNKAEAVVLGKGSLAQALRATMAIPGVFTPVNYDEWLLVDGGALNNIPANVVKEMGADIVIAVNVGADVANDQQIQQSLFALLGRTIDTMMTTGVREALKSADLVLDPDLQGLSSTSWRQSDELADRGYTAAEKEAARLQALAMSATAYAEFQTDRAAKRRVTVPAPVAVSVTGVGAAEQRLIGEALAGNIGRPLDSEQVSVDILRTAGTDRYEYLTYRLVEQPEGPSLLVGVQPKRYGPPFLAIGLEMSNVDSSNFAVNLVGRVTTFDWFGRGSELRLDAGLGTRQLAAAEIYRPLGSKGLFIAPRAYFSRTPRNGYFDERLVAEYRFKRTGAGFDAGFNSGHATEIRLGIDSADVRGRLRIGSPILPEVEGAEQFASLQVTFDNQTSPVVPTRGHYSRARLRYFFGAPRAVASIGNAEFENVQDFWQGEVFGTWFNRVGTSADRWFVLYGAGTSFGERPLINDFSLGGPLRLGAFNNDELRAPNYLLATGGYLKRLGRLPDVLGGNIFLGGWFEQGSTFDQWDDARYRSSTSVGAVLETLIGPVFAGASVDFDGHRRVYLSVGPLMR